MYAQVALTLPSPHRVFEIPATALYNDAQGLRVADRRRAEQDRTSSPVDDRARHRRDASRSRPGSTGDERVVKLADASLTAGTDVEVVVPTPPAAAPAAPAAEKKK